jgi:RNA polymerase sigma-70 factor (ECF subfamily)
LGEVFLQVARDLCRFRGDDEGLRRWVMTIARHRLIDAKRREARRPALAGEPVPEIPVPTEPAPGLDAEMVAALSQLTPEQREIVVLRFVADLSLEDVAKLTKRRAGAVKALQHRALSQLARILSGPGGAVQGDD